MIIKSFCGVFQKQKPQIILNNIFYGDVFMLYDCIVIGAGPAGLSAAINLNRRGKSVCVLSGGANLLTRAEKVENYLGFTGVSGKQLMNAFLHHAEKLEIPILYKTAANVAYFDNSFMINADGDILNSKALIIACGAAKAKPYPGEDRLLGRGVSYCATCDGMFYKNKTVVVAALTESAISQAKFLADIGVNVTVVAKSKPDNLNGLNFIQGTISEIIGENTVGAVILRDGTKISCDGVFILRASIAPDKLIPDIETENGFIKTDRSMSTNIKGLFAAGDCTGEPLQAAKAVGEGQIAALSCAEYLDGLQ